MLWGGCGLGNVTWGWATSSHYGDISALVLDYVVHLTLTRGRFYFGSPYVFALASRQVQDGMIVGPVACCSKMGYLRKVWLCGCPSVLCLQVPRSGRLNGMAALVLSTSVREWYVLSGVSFVELRIWVVFPGKCNSSSCACGMPLMNLWASF